MDDEGSRHLAEAIKKDYRRKRLKEALMKIPGAVIVILLIGLFGIGACSLIGSNSVKTVDKRMEHLEGTYRQVTTPDGGRPMREYTTIVKVKPDTIAVYYKDEEPEYEPIQAYGIREKSLFNDLEYYIITEDDKYSFQSYKGFIRISVDELRISGGIHDPPRYHSKMQPIGRFIHKNTKSYIEKRKKAYEKLTRKQERKR